MPAIVRGGAGGNRRSAPFPPPPCPTARAELLLRPEGLLIRPRGEEGAGGGGRRPAACSAPPPSCTWRCRTGRGGCCTCTPACRPAPCCRRGADRWAWRWTRPAPSCSAPCRPDSRQPLDAPSAPATEAARNSDVFRCGPVLDGLPSSERSPAILACRAGSRAGDAMIDLAWSEIALIAVVALVVIGPKDLPEAVRGVARGVQKLRRMAGEFRGQADELVREANLDELRQQIHDIRNFNVRDEFEKAVDKDGSLRRSFDDPLRDTYTPPTAYTPRRPAPPWKARPPRRAPPSGATATDPPAPGLHPAFGRRRRGAAAAPAAPPPSCRRPSAAAAAAPPSRRAPTLRRPRRHRRTPAVHSRVSSSTVPAATGRRPDRRQADAVDRPPAGAAPAAPVVDRRLRASPSPSATSSPRRSTPSSPSRWPTSWRSRAAASGG